MTEKSKPNPAEMDCLKRLVAGDDAWPEFWQHFGWVVKDEVHKFGKDDHQLRMDTFQELVLKLLNNDCRTIRGHLRRRNLGGFGAYLRRMTRNLLIDKWRKLERNRKLMLELCTKHGVPESQWAINGTPGNGDFRGSKAEKLLLVVTGENRDNVSFQILSRRFIEGESVKYIASQLGMQPNAVTKQVVYYRKKLLKLHKVELAELNNE